MSQPVASKNLYELLGNDPELDPDREPEPPTVVADKALPRSGKRGGDVAPKAGQRGEAAAKPRNDKLSGNERAIRDKTAGSAQNREKPIEEGARQDRPPRDGASGRGRSSRGGSAGYASRGMRGARAPRDDRHSKTAVGDSEKQAGHGWGDKTAAGELDDETGGLADARQEEKEGIVVDGTPVGENGTAEETPAEPEDNSKSYEQYLAEQLEKRAALNDRPAEVRKPNEGSSKKFPDGTAVTREEQEEFFVGGGGKKQRPRERKEKSVVDIDQTWVEQEATRGGAAPRGGRGGRGRGEGTRGRGEGRGRGGARGGRGDGAPRGSARGGEGRGGEGRGGFRGGRGGASSGPALNANDFPSLGA